MHMTNKNDSQIHPTDWARNQAIKSANLKKDI